MTLKKVFYYTVLAAIFLIPIFPLLVANSFFFPFITGKAFYFRILVEVAFACWIILACLDAKYRPKVTPLTIAVTLFAFITLLADLMGMSFLRSFWSNFERMEGWLVIVHLWMFFMAATNTFGSGEAGKRMWHRWFNTSLVIALMIAIYGLVQLSGGAAIHQGSSRIDASLGNAAYMAVYMLIHFFIVSYLFFVAKARMIANSGFLVWAYLTLAVFFAFIIFETQTRGTILGLIGGIMLALALYSIFGKGESKKSRIISAGIIGGIILLGIIFWLNRTSSFVKHNEVLNRLATISINDTKTQARGYVWPMAIKGFSERPILGWGQENFNYIFNTNYNPKMWSQEQWFDRAHSVYLDWLTASGFVGLISYLALYVLFVVAVWKSTLSKAEKSVLTGLLAGYAVHNIFVFDNLASYVFFFAAIGFASSLREGKSIATLGAEPVKNEVVEYILAPIAIVAFVLVLYFLNVRPIQANTRLIVALQSCGNGKADTALFENDLNVNSYMANQEIREQLITCVGNVTGGQYPGPTKQAFRVLGDKEIKAQIAATPKDARIYTLAGSFFNQIGQFADAEPLLETAHKLSPEKQTIVFQLASALVNLNKNEQALVLLKEAYEADPTYDEAASAYATILIISGKDAEAQKIFATKPSILETERIAQAYVSIKQYSRAMTIYQKLIAADPKNVDLRARLAQIQYTAGLVSEAIVTMREIEKDHPELKDQIEAAIKQVQK